MFTVSHGKEEQLIIYGELLLSLKNNNFALLRAHIHTVTLGLYSVQGPGENGYSQ